MTFLALIIGVVLLQVWADGRDRYDGWFSLWQDKVWHSGLSQELGFALLVLAPALLVLAFLNALESVLFGLLWIAVAVALLLYAFGRKDFSTLVERYCHYLRQGDFEAAWLFIQNELGTTAEVTAAEESTPPDEEVATSAQSVHEGMLASLIYEGYQRWFAVVFYFVLLGPAAALAYRMLQLALVGSMSAIARRWLALVDWIPARLLALTFALAGDFVGSRKVLPGLLPRSGISAESLLSDVGRSAVASVNASNAGEGEVAANETREIAALLGRSAAVWFVVFSLLELFL